MRIVDAVNIQELTQTEVDPDNHATTIHTKIDLPDGGTGFLIIGRIVTDKKKKWLPLKEVISKVLIEYDEKYSPSSALQAPSQEDSLLAE